MKINANQIKPHKSAEDIAKIHNVNVKLIKAQLKIGIKSEQEHTKDIALATDIALQHLAEIPDYYTRLNKMETDAKKSMKESHDEEAYRSIKGSISSSSGSGDSPRNTSSLGAFARLQQQNREALANAKKQKKKKKKNVDESVLSGKKSEIKPSRGIGALTKNAAAQLGDKAVELRKKEAAKVSLPKLKIKNESITIEDANGNTFLEIIDIIKAPSLKDRLKEQSDNYQYGEFDKEVQEISRLHKSGQLTPEQRVKRLLQAKNLKRVKKP